MRAVVIERHGGPEVVTLRGDLPQPAAGPGEVVVAVRAAALNHLDIWVRNGMPGMAVALPHILGSDGAGVVAEVGAGVTGVRVGEAVVINPSAGCGGCEFCRAGEESQCIRYGILGENRPGTFAEQVAVAADHVHPLPAGLSFTEAAAFPLVFLTAWRLLVTKGKIRAGQDVLIHGIGGGVASAALLIARLHGCRTLVTSSSPQKLAKARELGADFTVNYRQEDVAEAVTRFTGKRGVDVVLDTVGAATWRTSLETVRKGGRIVTCGATSGPHPETDIQRIFWKQLTICGSTMGTPEEFRQLWRTFDQGRLRPLIDTVYPLAQIGEAQARMERGEQFGKLVVTF